MKNISTCSWGFNHKSTEKYLLLGFLRKNPKSTKIWVFLNLTNSNFVPIHFVFKKLLWVQKTIFLQSTQSQEKKSNFKQELSSSLDNSSLNRVHFWQDARYTDKTLFFFVFLPIEVLCVFKTRNYDHANYSTTLFNLAPFQSRSNILWGSVTTFLLQMALKPLNN